MWCQWQAHMKTNKKSSAQLLQKYCENYYAYNIIKYVVKNIISLLEMNKWQHVRTLNGMFTPILF